MAEITCTVWKVSYNGLSRKKYTAKFQAMRGVIKCHERLDDALLFTMTSVKRILVGKKRAQKKITSYFAVKYDELEGETPLEIQNKTVTVKPNGITVE